MNFSKSIRDIIEKFFRKSGVKYCYDEENQAFWFYITKGKKQKYIYKYYVSVYESSVLIYVYPYLKRKKLDEDACNKISLLLHRANWDIAAGNFEFCPEKCEVRFKMNLQYSNDVEFEIDFFSAIIITLMTCDRYIEALQEIVEQNYILHNL